MVSVVNGVATDTVSGLGVGEYVVVARYDVNSVYMGGVGVGELVVDFISGFVANVEEGSTEWGIINDSEIITSGTPSIDSDGVHSGSYRQVLWKRPIPIPSVVTINGYSSGGTDRRTFFFLKTNMEMGTGDTKIELTRDVGDTIFQKSNKNSSIESVTATYPSDPYTFKIILSENYSVLRFDNKSYVVSPLTVNGEIVRKCYYTFRKWSSNELITTGVSVNKPPYIIGEGTYFTDDSPTYQFDSDNWNKSSNVTVASGYTIKMGTGSSVLVYTANKLMRGDSITIRVNALSKSHVAYRIGISTINSTTNSTIAGGHLASYHKESGFYRIEQGTGCSKVSDSNENMDSTYKTITFSANSNGIISVTVNGETHTTTTTLPTTGAYLYIFKTSSTYDMIVDGVAYSYLKQGLTKWNELMQFSGKTPFLVENWRQYSGTNLTVSSTSTGNALLVPQTLRIIYPLDLGQNFTISMRINNGGATTTNYYNFGLYSGCPSNPVNNFGAGFITNWVYSSSVNRIQGLGSNTDITWELTSSDQTVVIKAVDGTVTYELGDGNSKQTYTRPNKLPTNKGIYFALYNGGNQNVRISSMSITVNHTSSETRVKRDFVSIEGAPVSDTTIPRTVFSDSNWNKTQSTSLVGNNGERLFLTPSTTSTTVANIACTKYIAVRRGEAVEIGLYIYQNDIDNNTVNMRVGLSTTTGTTYGSLTILAQYFQSTSHQVIANNTSNQTTTKTLSPWYKYVGFWVDKDGKITVKVDGETKTTNAVLPESGAYLFVTNYRQKSSVGVNTIFYHSYSGL